MQFVENGPDIPIELLSSHEEGKVVFFCGSGISFPAGLPLFDGLVNRIYQKLNEEKTEDELEAYNAHLYDTTLNLLQNRLIGSRKQLIQTLYDCLKIETDKIQTHQAILTLAKSRENAYHLISTNFDGLFQRAIKQEKLDIDQFIAPSLPIPNRTKWSGIVYIHGLLPDIMEYKDHKDHYVLTSADFGRAYLTERWASRFVTEMFRNYTICFVGYSLNDPIMRYLMDALSAARDNNENFQKPYIFISYDNEKNKKKNESRWRNKGIEPISYSDQNGHEKLHQTLIQWANDYRDGMTNVKNIITAYSGQQPDAYNSKRLLWALSRGGAEYFSKIQPLYSLEWVYYFKYSQQFKNEYFIFDLMDTLFQEFFDRDYFSKDGLGALNRKKYDSIVPNWKDIIPHIQIWLLRQINNPNLFKFIIDQGKLLHTDFKEKIRNILSDISLIKKSNNNQIEEIKVKYPDEIPSDFIYQLWNLLINDQIHIQTFMDRNLYVWQQQFCYFGCESNIILNLRKIISPKINFFNRKLLIDVDWNEPPENWRINFSHLYFGINSDFIGCIVKKARDNDCFALLQEFILALKSGLQLLELLYKKSDKPYYEESFFSLKSIGFSDQDHTLGQSVFNLQNKSYGLDGDQGALLLVLIRDFWVKNLEQDPNKATVIALNWFDEPFAVFKRLALYAATQDLNIPDKVWVSCLLDNDNEYLWSLETQREKFRVLAERGKGLNKKWQVKLEKAILKGRPPLDGLSEEQRRADIWHHLLTLQSSGLELSSTAQDFVNRVQVDYPQWTKPNKTHEFAGGYVYPAQSMDSLPKDYHDPQTESEMHQFLLDRIDQFSDDNNTMESWQYHRTWSNYCSINSNSALNILSLLLKEQHFIPNLWRLFFNEINRPDILKALWQPLSKSILGLSQDHMKAIAPICASWLFFCVGNDKEEIISAEDPDFLPIFKRIFSVLSENENIESEPIQDIYNYALNCPIGRLTLALIKFYFKSKPEKNSLLPQNIKLYFNQILANIRSDFIYGKVHIALYLYHFYYIDPQWAKQYLLPLLDWDKYAEAWVIWCGFCFNNRVGDQLTSAIKPYFIATASHYEDLQKGGRDYGRYYVQILVNITLHQGNILTDEELKYIYNILPVEALAQIIEILGYYLPEESEELNNFWQNRLQPFFIKIWPKSKDKFTDRVPDALVSLCNQSKEAFPIVMETLGDWLKPLDVQFLMMPLHSMKHYQLCQKFPNESLELLSKIIAAPVNSFVRLTEFLNEIKHVQPELEQDQRFQRLLSYCSNV